MRFHPDYLLIRWVYQPIADKVMDRTHHSCYWLAEQCTKGMTGGVVSWLAIDLLHASWTVCFTVLIVLMWLPLAWAMSQRAKAAERRWMARQAADAERLDVTGRLVILLFWLLIVFQEAINWRAVSPSVLVSWTSYISFYYFMACLPRPPRRQTAKLPVNAIPTAG